MSPFLDYRTYLQERHGQVLHRVPIDLGFGCPILAPDGTGGCAFCAEHRSRAMHLNEGMTLTEQVEAGTRFARQRYGATGFIAYFQAGSATHAPVDILRERVSEVLAAGEFPVLAFATRPDCLPDDVIDWLSELAREREVWVELGVQTAHDKTLEHMRRGHDAAASASAAHRLADKGIHLAAHLILGLPGESRNDMERTAVWLRHQPFSAVKIHNLHVLRGTPLEPMWRNGEARTMDEHEYGELLMGFLRHIPATWPLIRLTTESPKAELLAPKWWMSKGEFLLYIERQMIERGWRQGDLIGADEADHARPSPAPSLTDTQPIPVLMAPRRERATQPRLIRLLEAADISLRYPNQAAAVVALGFGCGSLGLDAFDILPQRLAPNIAFYGLGLEPGVLAAKRELYPDYDGVLTALSIHGKCRRTWGRISIHWGDPRRNIFRIRGTADVLLLEPEHPEQYPMLFSLDFLRRAIRLLSPGGVLLAASDAASLRGALQRLGLYLGQPSSTRDRCRGTVAAWDPARIREPLNTDSQRLLTESVSGIPYRDRGLSWNRLRILGHREQIVQRMQARGLLRHPRQDS